MKPPDDKPPAPPPPPPPPDPRALARRAARLTEEELLRECELEFFIASGPGGQPRNKNESAVRIRHLPTGVVASATERRSQWQNRGEALRRLREILTEMGRPPKIRKKTRVPASAKRKRLEGKKRVSEKKKSRSGWE
ncbi:MAG: peptide chain release factor-like protein [Myxococcales bacterium]